MSKRRTGFLQFYVKIKKVFRCFARFSSEQEHFTHGMYITALIRPFGRKNIEPIMFYEGTNAKAFKRSIASAVVVTSRSSSFEYTISVHAGASTGQNILEVYIIYLHGDMCQYMRFCHLSHVPWLRLACALLKFHQNFHILTHISM